MPVPKILKATIIISRTVFNNAIERNIYFQLMFFNKTILTIQGTAKLQRAKPVIILRSILLLFNK